jgi:hypothetical protein
MILRVYFIVSLIIAVLIFGSFFIIDYPIKQGYALAAVILGLGIGNIIANQFSSDKHPKISFTFFSLSLTIENYRLLFIGLVFISAGLFVWVKNRETPLGYLLFSYGVFFGGFTKLSIRRQSVQ